MRYICVFGVYDLSGVCIDQSEPWHRTFREHLLEIIALDQKKPEFYELDVVIGLQRMWRLLLSHITYEPQNVQENSPDYDRLRIILSYIEENYRNPITLKDISGTSTFVKVNAPGCLNVI